MCGTIFYCLYKDCTYETQFDHEEAMWCHLYEKHDIDFLKVLKVSCCKHLTSGIEKYAGKESVCGISRRSLIRYNEAKRKTEMEERQKTMEYRDRYQTALESRPEYVTKTIPDPTPERKIANQLNITKENENTNRIELYSPIMGKKETI